MEQINLFDEMATKTTSTETKTKYKTLKSREYPIDIRYGKNDWNMVAAIREVLANMLDTKAEYSYHWENGWGYIEDKGQGMPMSAFILGASDKSGDSTSIGQFGEGLKLTFITALRNDRAIDISTVGYGATIEKFYSEEDNSTLMRVNYNNNSRSIGTIVKIQCTIEEWNEAVGLFLQFKEDYQKVDNNLFLPGGYISIVGLITEYIDNLIFSYDVADKTILNRDRNAIKAKGLKDNMIKTLCNLKTQRAVKMYFEALQDNPEAEEFKLYLEPKNKEMWLTTLKRLYGENVCYTTTVQNDLKAQTKGYFVIRNITKHVVKTLKYLGIQSSKEVTSDIKGDVGFIEKGENRIKFTISEDYCSDWTFEDAGREFLANALDVSGVEGVKRYFKDGFYHIEDAGIGLQKEHFVIGNSQKKDSHIGKYGEGLKIASLVMTRQGREVEILTAGTTYTPIIEMNEEFGVNLFSIDYKANRRKSGTIVKFKATEEEVALIEGLFLAFRNDYRLIEDEYTDIVMDSKEGVIYANGLQSANVNTLLSYNVKDKKIVNTRDRNGVNQDYLDRYLEAVLNNVTDEEVIEKLLTGWMEDIHKYEYRLILNPININKFKKVADRLFEKSCIQTTDMRANVVARTAGYTLLNNIPPYIKEILIACGVSLAEDIAMEYEDGVILENRIVTVMSPEYASHWTFNDAVRELVSNAIDTETEFDLRYECGKGIVEDNGEGIKKRNLIFGETDKRDEKSKIGCFGEGLKMASLVLAKENRNIVIETVGFTFTPKIEYDEDFEVNLLVIYFKKNDREVGTKITFKAKASEIKTARNQFLAFNDNYKEVSENMYLPAGTIFVNGVAVETGVQSAYSYNISNIKSSDILGRDRKNIDYDYKVNKIGAIIGNAKEENVIKTIIKQVSKYSFEERIVNYICLVGRQKTIWRKVAEVMYPNSCLPSTNAYANMVAEDKEIRVLSNIGSTLSTLLNEMNFPTAEKMVSLRGDEDVARNVLSEEDLTPEERAKWNILKDVFLSEYGSEYENKVVICEEFTKMEHSKILGQYSYNHDCCYILRELLTKYSLVKALGIIAHEICHRESKESDMTRGFENALTDVIGNLLGKLYDVKED